MASPAQIRREMEATAAKIARWQSHPLPYCASRYDENAMRSRPFGKRRFATPKEALAHAVSNDARFRGGLMVDYYEAIAA